MLYLYNPTKTSLIELTNRCILNIRIHTCDITAYVPRFQYVNMHIQVNMLTHIGIRLPADNYLVLNGNTYAIYYYLYL
jgi:hypothetical protein